MEGLVPLKLLEGFNKGWIDFERNGIESRRGTIPLDTVIRELLEKNG